MSLAARGLKSHRCILGLLSLIRGAEWCILVPVLCILVPVWCIEGR